MLHSLALMGAPVHLKRCLLWTLLYEKIKNLNGTIVKHLWNVAKHVDTTKNWYVIKTVAYHWGRFEPLSTKELQAVGNPEKIHIMWKRSIRSVDTNLKQISKRLYPHRPYLRDSDSSMSLLSRLVTGPLFTSTPMEPTSRAAYFCRLIRDLSTELPLLLALPLPHLKILSSNWDMLMTKIWQ